MDAGQTYAYSVDVTPESLVDGLLQGTVTQVGCQPSNSSPNACAVAGATVEVDQDNEPAGTDDVALVTDGEGEWSLGELAAGTYMT